MYNLLGHNSFAVCGGKISKTINAHLVSQVNLVIDWGASVDIEDVGSVPYYSRDNKKHACTIFNGKSTVTPPTCMFPKKGICYHNNNTVSKNQIFITHRERSKRMVGTPTIIKFAIWSIRQVAQRVQLTISLVAQQVQRSCQSDPLKRVSEEVKEI